MAAVIDYILNETGFTELGLLTTSQGTTASLVLLSMRPEYNDKVNILVAYAPVANITHFTSPFRLLIPFAEEVKVRTFNLGRQNVALIGGVPSLKKAVNDLVTHGGFLVTNAIQQNALATVCDSFLREICYAPLAILYGKDPKQHNSTRVPVYVTNLPVGSSSQNVLHYAQADPPPYPLENIRVPFAIYQGEGDIFADPQDVQDLAGRLQKVLVRRKIMPDPDFGHLDFIFGYNAKDFLHHDMIDLISNYTSNDS
ncbi:hypothetical protein HPB51_012385 [Rhipicephalus microplus]|uniref:AB hydrolase-1 domain-containing protein n=1 Tax=Rhipicephalus microplus TaxID=6941 RepID=A0A9J6EA17_RHIMP|nr:hypothetical protein HPB51_012385 [Rhipicephalus microplus]